MAEASKAEIDRTRLVEKAAHAIHALALADGDENDEWDHLPLSVILRYRRHAREALDAAFPQVATASGLEALSGDAVVADCLGGSGKVRWTRMAGDEVFAAGPLTVVWQPQPIFGDAA